MTTSAPDLGMRAMRLVSELNDLDALFRAPGCVTLLGDPVGLDQGFALTAAIDLDCLIAARRRDDGIVRVRTIDDTKGPQTVEIQADGSEDPGSPPHGWQRDLASLVRCLANSGHALTGLEAVFTSTVPPGCGLGSGAAVEAACLLALTWAADIDLTAVERSKLCEEAGATSTQHDAVSGASDRLSVFAATGASALLIDWRTREARPVALPSGVSIIVARCADDPTASTAVETGLSEGADQSESDVRAQAQRVAADLGVEALRDATVEQVAGSPVAMHIVSENHRVLDAVEALRGNDLGRVTEVFNESQHSFSQSYGGSTAELDALARCLTDAGAIGARVTGSGSHRSVVALAARDQAQQIAANGGDSYALATGITPQTWITTAADAAGALAAR